MTPVAAAPGHAVGPLPALVLPPGVRDLALGLLRRAATTLGELDGTVWDVDEELADGHLVLPHVIAATNGLGTVPPPPAPWPAPGGGWVAVDLGPDDEDTFRTFCAVIDDEVRGGAVAPEAEAFAGRAQEWRLAVTPYRAGDPVSATVRAASPVPAGPGGQGPAGTPVTGRGRPLDGVRIVDLTVMWAGPLVTWLADRLGAQVWRVEPSCRPDGLRAGERPAGAGPGPGALHVALAGDKRRVDLDLRDAGDRQRFDALVAESDVVIDNLSPRVRPNLGIEPARLARLRPGLIDVSITAFAPGRPEQDWVAYGGGVHAAAGTAARPGPDGTTIVSPGAVAHADPLTGFAVFAALLDALADRRRGATGPRRIAASLQAALDPLPRHRATGPVVAAAVEPALLDDLTAWAGRLAGRTVVQDGCRILPPPFRLAGGTGPRPAGGAGHPNGDGRG